MDIFSNLYAHLVLFFCLEALSRVSLISQALLPNGYEQRVCSYTSIGDGFHATIRLKATSKAGALKWLSDFENKSLTTYRVRRTFPGSGRKNVFKVSNVFYVFLISMHKYHGHNTEYHR